MGSVHKGACLQNVDLCVEYIMLATVSKYVGEVTNIVEEAANGVEFGA